MINKVIYSGRIATDLKLRKSKNEKSGSVAKLNL